MTEVLKNQGNSEVFDKSQQEPSQNDLIVSLVEQLGIPAETTKSYIERLYTVLGPENQPERMIGYLNFKIAQRNNTLAIKDE